LSLSTMMAETTSAFTGARPLPERGAEQGGNTKENDPAGFPSSRHSIHRFFPQPNVVIGEDQVDDVSIRRRLALTDEGPVLIEECDHARGQIGREGDRPRVVHRVLYADEK
jgi:hypothetical protein